MSDDDSRRWRVFLNEIKCNSTGAVNTPKRSMTNNALSSAATNHLGRIARTSLKGWVYFTNYRLSTLSVKIVARTQNPLSSQDETTQVLRGEISRSNLHSVECHSTEWRFEWRSCDLPLVSEWPNWNSIVNITVLRTACAILSIANLIFVTI